MSSTTADRNTDILRRLRDLGMDWREEALATGRQLTELQLLLRQTVGELDRLSPRSSQASQRLRDMEAHIESYSRADIKEIYAAAHETQMRVFMMQMQQEQLEHKQRVLTGYREALQQVVSFADLVVVEEESANGADQDPESTISTQESLSLVIQAQEDERKRLARQIHDGPAQALANLVLRAEICERLMGQDPDLARNELGGLKGLVAGSLQETRRFIFDLRPMILDDLGLTPTLKRYCEMLEAEGVPIRLNISGGDRKLDPSVEIAIFRVAQEAVLNAIKHSQPNEIQVSVDISGAEASLTIQDDGRGCDRVAVLSDARLRRTVGLARMQDYVLGAHGTFRFESEPARGCRVCATLPLLGSRK